MVQWNMILYTALGPFTEHVSLYIRLWPPKLPILHWQAMGCTVCCAYSGERWTYYYRNTLYNFLYFSQIIQQEKTPCSVLVSSWCALKDERSWFYSLFHSSLLKLFRTTPCCCTFLVFNFQQGNFWWPNFSCTHSMRNPLIPFSSSTDCAIWHQRQFTKNSRMITLAHIHQYSAIVLPCCLFYWNKKWGNLWDLFRNPH